MGAAHVRASAAQKRQPAKPDVSEAEGDGGLRDDGDGVDAEQQERVTIRVCFICFSRRGIDAMRFRVNPLKNGRFTFSDLRGRDAGTGGTTGIWGTRPAIRAGQTAVANPDGLQGRGRPLYRDRNG